MNIAKIFGPSKSNCTICVAKTNALISSDLCLCFLPMQIVCFLMRQLMYNFRRSKEGFWFLLQMYLLVWGTRRRSRKKGISGKILLLLLFFFYIYIYFAMILKPTSPRNKHPLKFSQVLNIKKDNMGICQTVFLLINFCYSSVPLNFCNFAVFFTDSFSSFTRSVKTITKTCPCNKQRFFSFKN